MTPAVLTAALALTSGQVLQNAFDDGAIVGRVCDDVNHDGVCSGDEPGVPGARVMLETGLVATTDREGRFHFAAVPARAPDGRGGGRLLPGRHRLKVDPRGLGRGAVVTPNGATVELPMGAISQVDFAITRVGQEQDQLAPDDAPPALEPRGQGVRFQVRVRAPDGDVVRIGEAEAGHERGVATAWVELTRPLTRIAIVSQSSDGHVELALWPVELVRRAGSVMVIPRAIERLCDVELPTDPRGGVTLQCAKGAQVVIDGEAVALDDNGRGTRAAPKGKTIELSVGLADATWAGRLSLPVPTGLFAVALLDLETTFDPAHSTVGLTGRGAGALRASAAGFDVSLDLDLRDADFEAIKAGGVAVLMSARRAELFDRQLEAARVPLAWDDGSAITASNAPESRFRLQVARDGIGRVGFGSWRAQLADGELGRFHRALEAGFVELSAGGEAWDVRARGFAAPGGSELTTRLGRRPAHERFEATGGSLIYLAHPGVVAGSELVRVELRDALTGLPIEERHLLRGRDYSVDAVSGRLLLARPLSFVAMEALLRTEPLTSAVTPVLVVDYEYVDTDVAFATTAGGEVSARVGPVTASGGFVRDGAYTLVRGLMSAKLGGVHLSAEAARSSGAMEGLGWSADGGFSFLSRSDAAPTSGWGLALRARGAGLGGKGFFDVAWRWREAGFEDTSAVGALRQLSLRAEQPFGPISMSLLGDLREGNDPRFPFEARPVKARILGVGVGWERDDYGVRLEVRDSQLATDPLGEGLRDGGRLSVGLNGRYRVASWLTVRAGYRQRVWERGSGEGAWDDSFASLGADVKVGDGPQLGLRGGWGPRLGPQVWGTATYTRGEETWYGLQSLDVDSPSAGERRLITGARREVGPGTAVFAEDVVSHDVDALRYARAVGLMQQLGEGLTVSARYERGLRSLVDAAPTTTRDAAGATFAWETQRGRLFARGEGRWDQGGVPLTQFLATAGGELQLTSALQAIARVQVSNTMRAGALDARLVDASLSVAWRFDVGTVVARYGWLQELLPASRGAGAERRVQLISVLPTVRIGSRVTVAAGAHAAVTPDGLVLSGSLRPAVRIIAGLDVGVEVARRTSAPDGGELTALRGEIGYRFDDRFRLAAGYTALGFSGTGLEAGAADSRNRAYVRAEVGY